MMTPFRMAFLSSVLALGCAPSTTKRLGLPPLQAVDGIDLDRYVGRWYEIASYPQRFQEGCTGTTATYTLKADNEVEVLNECRKYALDGEPISATGVARVVNEQNNAELEVSFFWPFWGDYWIIDLGAEYDYAVIGQPSRDYLWILSRTPEMSEESYGAILERVVAKGYPLEPLQKTLQVPKEQVTEASDR